MIALVAFCVVFFVFYSFCIFGIGVLRGEQDQSQNTEAWKEMYDTVWKNYVNEQYEVRRLTNIINSTPARTGGNGGHQVSM